jgi:hypothetical protein
MTEERDNERESISGCEREGESDWRDGNSVRLSVAPRDMWCVTGVPFGVTCCPRSLPDFRSSIHEVVPASYPFSYRFFARFQFRLLRSDVIDVNGGQMRSDVEEMGPIVRLIARFL